MLLLGVTGRSGAGKDAVTQMIAPRHVARLGRETVTVRDRDAADCLVPQAIQQAFADPMKMLARAIYDFSPRQLWGASEHRNAPDERYPRFGAHDWDPEPGPTQLPPPGFVCLRCGRRCEQFSVEDLSETCRTFLTPREALQKLGTEAGRKLYENTWVDLLLRNIDGFAAPLVVISDTRFDNEARAIRVRGGKVWRIERPGVGLTGETAAHVSEAGVSDVLVDRVIVNDGTLDDLRECVCTSLAIDLGIVASRDSCIA